MTDHAKLFVPEGTGPYNVEGTAYDVEDGQISVVNPDHIPLLKSLGASETPLDGLPYSARIASQFGPTQEEHDALRARHDELVLQAESVNRGLDRLDATLDGHGIERLEGEDTIATADRLITHLIEELTEARAAREGTDTPATGLDASGDTSESLAEAVEIEDPGFTVDSDYKTILDWLKDHGAVVPGNISKADALTAVASVVDASKKKD